LFPDVDLQYRGYMLWRGLLPERNLHDSATLESLVPRLSFPDQPGHFVAYLVPGEAGSTAPGERLVNWACYIALPQERLDSFMVDRSGHVRRGTIPPGELRADEEARLAAMMVRSLPAYYGEIVEASEQTYVQLIYTAQVPAYRSGRACLIGDAGSVAQPFTGSGVFKGYNNVSSLVRALASRESLDTALDAWSSEQTRVGNQVLKLGEQMEDAFIWNSLDLVEAGADEVERWFRDAISFPENATG
jgi:2-polyprenyl-6-methoxyphenol hydroxylase-like FAD-dependent oxidoreductase